MADGLQERLQRAAAAELADALRYVVFDDAGAVVAGSFQV